MRRVQALGANVLSSAVLGISRHALVSIKDNAGRGNLRAPFWERINCRSRRPTIHLMTLADVEDERREGRLVPRERYATRPRLPTPSAH